MDNKFEQPKIEIILLDDEFFMMQSREVYFETDEPDDVIKW